MFCSMFFLSACEKDKPTNSPAETVDIKLEKVIHYLPIDKFKQNSVAVFVNQDGDEKTLNISITEDVAEKVIDGKPYKAERIRLQYSDPDNSHYTPDIVASANYTSAGVYNEYVSCTLYTSVHNGFLPQITIDDNGEALFSGYYETYSILDKEFINVFASLVPPDLQNSFSKIYYTVEDGVIGFEGEKGIIWVFKKFKKH